MNYNYIVSGDIKKANPMLTIKCGFCKSQELIQNHISLVKDYIDNQDKLHGCKECGAKTRIHPDDLNEAKEILGID